MKVFTRFILFNSIFLCLFACDQKKQPIQSDIHKYAYQPPKTFVFTYPQPVNPDTCLKPQTIELPHNPVYYSIKTKSGTKILHLLPPETKAADSISQMHNYTSDNGLALDAIACACMDHFGNLWFGTAGNGVSRYDGKSFTNFTEAHGLCNNQVINILEDKNGNMWFGTWGGGVSRYDGRSFVTFTTAQGLGNNIVRAILEDKNGNLWFGTDGGGVSRYDGVSFKNFTVTNGLCNNSVYCILEDKAGNLWFGTNGGGVSRYNGKSFTNYTTAQGLVSNSINSCTEDNSGNLWFGTAGSGVSRYDGKSFRGFTTLQGLANNLVYCAIKDKQGNLWFGTDGGGVSRYDGKSFINYTTAQGLANNNVHSILEDKAGNLWFGTIGGGLSEYTRKPFVNYTTAQGLSNNMVITILEDKAGNVWFGTYGGGVVRYNGKSFTTFTTLQGLPNNIVISSLEDKAGNLWFGTFGGGVVRYDGKSFTVFTTAQGLANDNVRGILEDKKGNIWFCTAGGGVSVYDGKVFTTFDTKQGLCNNNVISVAEDKKGNLWFGTDGGGISRYNGNSFTNYTSAQGLANNIVYGIAEDKYGYLWFGTFGGGLSRYDGKSFINYDKSAGLPDNNILSVLIDKQEDIVIGTNDGIAVCSSFKPKLPDAVNGLASMENGRYIRVQNNLTNEYLKNYDPVFEVYNSKTGYAIKDVNGANNNGAMLCDRNGNIWVGTGNEKTALVHFTLTAVTRNSAPPSLMIQNIKINDENLCWYNLIPRTLPFYRQISGDTAHFRVLLQQQSVMTYWKILTEQEIDTIRRKYYGIRFDSVVRYYPLPQNLELPYQANHITFEYAAIEPDLPNLVHYQYFLKGYDKEWSAISNKTSATFGNMGEGTYTFMLKAESPDGVWSEPITYTFKVSPPWYRAWWAFLFYAVGSISALYLIFRWRTSNLIRHQKHLEQIVAERTADLIAEKQEVETQKNKAEAQKSRAERSEQFKQQFLANMSHEIRTPMNAVSGMTDLLLEKGPRPDQLEYLTAISKSSDILLHIINDILDLSKIEAGKLELENIDFSLAETIKQVKDTLSYKAEEKGLQIITNIDDSVPEVLIGDPFRINQILINLGGNAIKFTQKGGIQIDIKRLKEENGNQVVRFSVADTGIGIPKDKLQGLFESFSQVNTSDARKFGGTGLGLSISKQLVELQGGNITVESIEGRGTTFSFVITYQAGSAEKLRQRIYDEQKIDGSVLNGLRILVADDNEYNRLLVNETLHLKADVDIDLVTNGQEAIQMLKQKDYDVILMDVQMPVMNGIDATKYIRNKMTGTKSKTPVIAFTASILRADLDMCLESGMNSYMPKPFKPWQLVHAISDVTDRKSILIQTPGEKNVENAAVANGPAICDLAYLREFCEGDAERIEKYIRIFLAALPRFEDKIRAAIVTKDPEEIAGLIHSFKPKWMMMGMKQTNELGQKIEALCSERANVEKITEYLQILIDQNRQSITELERIP